MSKFLSILLLFLSPIFLISQNSIIKKELGHEELVSWQKIIRPKISNDGNWVVYTLKGEEGDGTVKIYDAVKNQLTSFDRASLPTISADNQFVFFNIKPASDSLKALRRQKVDKKDLPKNHLGIYNLSTNRLDTIKEVKKFKAPSDWGGWVAYLKESQEIVKVQRPIADTTKTKEKIKVKKENAKNGTTLYMKNLQNQEVYSFPFVLDFQLSKENNKIAYTTTGNDSTVAAGIYLFNCTTNKNTALWKQKGDYKNLVFDEAGKQLAFHANFDTTNAEVAPFELFYWKEDQSKARSIANNNSALLPDNWRVSEHKKPRFSKNGRQLFWGIAPAPILQDTALLEEEIVKVEVWHWQDAKLHTQQKAEQDREAKRSYTVVYHPATNLFTQISNEESPEVRFSADANVESILAYNELPYYKEVSWEGGPAGRDVYIVNSQTGRKKQIATGVRGSVNLSPVGKYAFAYVSPDSAWYAYNVSSGKAIQMTNNEEHPFYDELNDRPMHPRSSGYATWAANDEYFLVYDRYDLWKVDPTGNTKSVRLTQGREKKWRYRYLRLDREKFFVNKGERLLLKVFDEVTKESGYAWLDWETGVLTTPTMTSHYYGTRPIKAKNADKIVFTRENFRTYPNLLYSNLNFDAPKEISDANPQQQNFQWGSAELYKWTSLSGEDVEGLLIKPDNFDPKKKYPLIVNFYERNSDGLYRHRAPFPHRSTINYSFYVSKGYVIFNPDIKYINGYPGQSCYNAVVSGVTSLIKDGFIDKERIGVQGHSWGGYQIAYLLNKTNIFKCAESGAPVVNMFSAYGGIRWGSGMSRMFQYEKTQSRIGGTIWEYPLRYIENSPLFELDKTNTPVLIMHNDKDAAVPWYQGIEYFTALRRLGKPAWLLNYNGEPHWPVKLQNRKDFNIRMQQYFDHYLKGEAMPQWMSKGIPALEKGIRQGLELEQVKN